MHSQKTWEERIGDHRLPGWFRVASAAYGMHRKNGHANFSQGSLRLITGTLNTSSGEIVPNANVSRDIKTAVRYGLIHSSSRTTCLVVNSHEVWGGAYGTAHAPCLVHK
jgi:hypothetical protein